MSRLGSVVLFGSLLLAIVWASWSAESTLGATWVETHRAQLRRVLNIPPSMRLEFKQVENTPAPEYKLVVFDVHKGEETFPFELHVSRDGQRILYDGRFYDMEDPFGGIREQIRLDNVPARGPADAPVTIVEYSDFTCVYCRQFFLFIEKPVLERYGDQVRFLYKHLPLTGLRSWSEDAAVAGACAFRQGNQQFWALHEQLFQQAERLREGRPVLLQLARKAGLNLRAFRTCFDQREARLDVARDVEEAERLNVNGTPTFFINGRPLVGLANTELFFRVIDEELAAAQTQ